MKKITAFFILIYLIYYTPPIVAANNFVNQSSVSFSPQLEKHWRKIKEVPEVLNLIHAIQKEGPIQIVINNGRSNQFGAYWDPDHRVIAVACNSHSDEGSVIGSILFELHNASVNKEFERLSDLVMRRKMNKETYIKSMEYLEYINSLNSAKLAEIGIQRGIFPATARMPTYSSFQEHFLAQKESGHSDCFARIFDNLLNH